MPPVDSLIKIVYPPVQMPASDDLFFTAQHALNGDKQKQPKVYRIIAVQNSFKLSFRAQ
jgi:hypothetical protein